jgi:hypothetical protein
MAAALKKAEDEKQVPLHLPSLHFDSLPTTNQDLVLQVSAMELSHSKRLQQQMQQHSAALSLAAEREQQRLESRHRPISAIQVRMQ